MNTGDLLTQVAAQGLSSVTKEDMVKLACAYWHEHYVPDVNRVLTLDTEELRVAGYLTEFFSTFNCLEEQDALRLVNVANKIKALLKPGYRESDLDEIAKEWGMTRNLNPFLADLLFYQTRHYKHSH